MNGKHPLSDLDADIRDHIERETQENIERGMSAEEARQRSQSDRTYRHARRAESLKICQNRRGA